MLDVVLQPLSRFTKSRHEKELLPSLQRVAMEEPGPRPDAVDLADRRSLESFFRKRQDPTGVSLAQEAEKVAEAASRRDFPSLHTLYQCNLGCILGTLAATCALPLGEVAFLGAALALSTAGMLAIRRARPPVPDDSQLAGQLQTFQQNADEHWNLLHNR